MPDDPQEGQYPSFLGTGWSFPPEFVRETGVVALTTDEADIAASLKILLNTSLGERFLQPRYGFDLRELLFEPLSTTMQTYIKDRLRIAMLIYEPRIKPLALEVDTSAQHEGRINIILDYEVRATNSRFNLVFPFYRPDSLAGVRSVTP